MDAHAAPAAAGLLSRLQQKLHSVQQNVSRLMSEKMNRTKPRVRRVSFRSTTAVYEFERQPFGGGGIPDDDGVSLGLSPRLLNSYAGPLHEKDEKDEYGGSGALAEEQRLQLLAEFSSERKVKRELDSIVAPMILRTRRERQETAESEEEQRYMPGSLEEAVRVAQEDEEFARRHLRECKDTSASAKRIGSAIRKRKLARSGSASASGDGGGKRRQTDGEQGSGVSATSSSFRRRKVQQGNA